MGADRVVQQDLDCFTAAAKISVDDRAMLLCDRAIALIGTPLEVKQLFINRLSYIRSSIKYNLMITVIIPVLNEEESIADVVRFALSNKKVSEVIVVDDKSLDHTVKRAKEAGAKVITSTRLGKGASMKDGLLCATNKLLVYLDGDIHPYPAKTIDDLTAPIIKGDYDFVKATFRRNAGRVTELVAKPLLNILFPKIAHFNQLLSGMIAGKKELLQQVDFFDDYGVDIGILLDMYLLKARITEVDIGYIENKSRSWQSLGKMSREVSLAIIRKASVHNQRLVTLEELQSFSEIRDQMDFALQESLVGLEKMAIFDLDKTFLRSRFIDTCAGLYGFEKELMNIRSMEKDVVTVTKNIARLMKGLNISQVLAVTESIPIVEDAVDTIAELKKRGCVVGITTDSYDVVANHVKNKIGADFSMANELEFSRSITTGEVKLPSFFFNQPSICKHSLRKTNVMQYILHHYHIDINNTITIGDSDNDICMVKYVGIGVAFCSGNELLNFIADKIITTPAFSPIPEFA